MSEQLLPHSPEAEKGLLCSFLLASPEVGALCRTTALKPESFYLSAHSTVYAELLKMEEEEIPVDPVTLTQSLADSGFLDEAGGPALVSEVFTFLPTAANVEFYLNTVLEKARDREAIRACGELAKRVYEGDVAGLAEAFTAAAANYAAGAAIRSTLPSWDDAAGLLQNMPPEPPELVYGLLHQGSKLMLGGASKSYKTWTLLDLAISVATGADWWGFTTRPGRVLFLNCEIQKPFAARRIARICEAKGVTLDAGQLVIWNLRGHTADLAKLGPEIIRQAKGKGFVLIVADPIYKLTGGRDENAAGDIGEMVREMERIANECDCAFAFAHHFAKGNAAGKDVLDRTSGSGVFARDPDAILTLTAHQDEGSFTVEPILRNHAPVEPFVLKWEFPLMTPDDSADPSQLKRVSGGRERKWKPEQIAEAIGDDEELTTSELQRRVSRECGMPRATFYELIKDRETLKLISKSNGKWSRRVR